MRAHLVELVARELHRIAVGQPLDVHLSRTEKRAVAADERQHPAVGRKLRRRGGVGEVGELRVLGARRRLRWLTELRCEERTGRDERDDERRGRRQPIACPGCLATSTGDAAKIDDHLAHRLKAIGGIFLERLLDDHPQRSRYVRGQRIRDASDRRSLPAQDLVQHNSEGENVAARVDGASRCLLRRHVRRGPDNDSPSCTQVGRSSERVVWQGVVQLRQSKVGQLRVATLRDQNVLGLDIAMQNAGLMRCGEAVRDAGQQVDRLAPAMCARRPVPKRPAVDELGDKILTALDFIGVVHGEDVRMIEPGRRLRFALEAPARGRVCDVAGEELDRNGPPELGVQRPIHDAHAAGAEARLHDV